MYGAKNDHSKNYAKILKTGKILNPVYNFNVTWTLHGRKKKSHCIHSSS